MQAQPGQPPAPQQPQQPAFSGWGSERAPQLTLAQIQAQEEVERQLRDVEAARAEEERRAAAASSGAAGSVWAAGGLPAILAQPAPPTAKPASFADLMAQQNATAPKAPPAQQRAAPPAAPRAAAAPTPQRPAPEDDEDALLWDYGAAPAPPVTAAPPPPATASPTKAAVTPVAKGKKKGKGGAVDPAADAALSNGAAMSPPASATFGGGDGGMDPKMTQWCGQQMLALTGNDDTTLADFLFSLPTDDEVHSYLTMYLGKSAAIDTFAREFTLRKRAARGTGESAEWTTAGRRGGKDSPATKGDEDANGFQAPKGKKCVRGLEHLARCPRPPPNLARVLHRVPRLPSASQGPRQKGDRPFAPWLLRRVEPHHAGGDRLPRVSFGRDRRPPSTSALRAAPFSPVATAVGRPHRESGP